MVGLLGEVEGEWRKGRGPYCGQVWRWVWKHRWGWGGAGGEETVVRSRHGHCVCFSTALLSKVHFVLGWRLKKVKTGSGGGQRHTKSRAHSKHPRTQKIVLVHFHQAPCCVTTIKALMRPCQHWCQHWGAFLGAQARASVVTGLSPWKGVPCRTPTDSSELLGPLPTGRWPWGDRGEEQRGPVPQRVRYLPYLSLCWNHPKT